LVPIGFGVVLANLPGGGMGVVDPKLIELENGQYMNLFEIAHE
jgi:oxaloacetate decarboxylase beta subunit